METEIDRWREKERVRGGGEKYGVEGEDVIGAEV